MPSTPKVKLSQWGEPCTRVTWIAFRVPETTNIAPRHHHRHFCSLRQRRHNEQPDVAESNNSHANCVHGSASPVTVSNCAFSARALHLKLKAFGERLALSRPR